MVEFGGHFDIKRLGRPGHFVGWAIEYPDGGGVSVGQRGYIESMAARYGDAGARPKATPMAYGAELDGSGPPGDARLFMEIIGSLLFAAIGTRPDIAAPVSILSRHMSKPTRAHVTAARAVVNYLANTPELCLHYPPAECTTIEVYCDASFAPDECGRRSRTGMAVLINGAPVGWKSTLQRSVAHSTAEAEYIAMSDAVREAMYFRQLLGELGHHVETITVYEDNQVAKRMAEEVATKRSKHIDIRYHHVRELVAAGIVKIVECRTENMLADMLTKPLPKDKFYPLRDRLMAKGEC
jgi:hypothetical protein